MGKTSKPLSILLTDSRLLDIPEFKAQVAAMQEQGHVIDVKDMPEYHFIAGPNCWYLVPEVLGLFNQAVENARKVASADKTGTVKQAAKKTAKGKSGKGSKSSSKDSKSGTSTGQEGLPLDSAKS